MKVKYSFLCEAANISQSGNLNILGIFRNICTRNVPFTFSKMFFVCSVEFNPDEIGTHKFKLNFIDVDGHNILPTLEGELLVSEDSQFSNIVLGLDNVVFKKLGSCEFNMFIDGNHVSSESLSIMS